MFFLSSMSENQSALMLHHNHHRPRIPYPCAMESSICLDRYCQPSICDWLGDKGSLEVDENSEIVLNQFGKNSINMWALNNNNLEYMYTEIGLTSG